MDLPYDAVKPDKFVRLTAGGLSKPGKPAHNDSVARG